MGQAEGDMRMKLLITPRLTRDMLDEDINAGMENAFSVYNQKV